MKPKENVLRLDAVTKSFLKLNPGVQITVTQCPKCGLWHDESLGHRCPKKGERYD